MAKPIVQLGLVGTGPAWETHYRPALEALSDRLSVRTLYDAVPTRGRARAEHLGCVHTAGLRELLSDERVDGLVVLDLGWAPEHLLSWLGRQPKPVYFGDGFQWSLELLSAIHDRAQREGWTRMPEFTHRYTPAATRLQELLATSLGRLQRIELELPADSNLHARHDANSEQPPVETLALAGWLDWCNYLMRSIPRSLDVQHSGSEAEVTIEYPAAAPQTTRHVHLKRTGAPSGNGTHEPTRTPNVIVHAAEGTATLLAADRLLIRTASGEETTEELTADRSAHQTLLDLFCRRVVGGLISVPNLDDFAHALRMAEEIEGRE